MAREVDSLLKDFIEEILELATDAHKSQPSGDYKDGMMLAYASALCVFKYKLEALEPDNIAEYGLDFDVDGRFLCGNATEEK